MESEYLNNCLKTLCYISVETIDQTIQVEVTISLVRLVEKHGSCQISQHPRTNHLDSRKVILVSKVVYEDFQILLLASLEKDEQTGAEQ